MSTHSGFPCKLCSQVDPIPYRSGMKIIHVLCNKAFSLFISCLTQHQLIYANLNHNRKDNPHPWFSSPPTTHLHSEAGHLKQHRLIYTGQNNQLCDVCFTAFTKSGDLTPHKLIHTGQKSHGCDVCRLFFLQVTTDAINLNDKPDFDFTLS